ncbi:hypothetical protein PI125_g2098 [Phytophthora idaei]|nr:hypothetical protein PI125_g2098 [Phytophthora idaei]KAG3171420.1 hypothetical protein PI126_g1907 [Phytophthora idaei]
MKDVQTMTWEEWVRRYYATEAQVVRAKVRERRQRRGEEANEGNGRALRAVAFQLPEESMFELYAAGDESEAKVHCVYSISASGIPLLSR